MTLKNKSPQILIIDDDPTLAEGLKRLLNADSYRVLASGSEQEALFLWRSEFFNLIVLNLSLPNIFPIFSTPILPPRQKERVWDSLLSIVSSVTTRVRSFRKARKEKEQK